VGGARRILKEHKGALHRLAARLIEKETLDGGAVPRRGREGGRRMDRECGERR